MAPGSAVSPDAPWTVSSIVAASLSTVLASSSTESFAAWPDGVSGVPSPFRSSTSVLVEVLTSFAALSSPSCDRDDGSVNCSVTLWIESVQVVTAVQKPLAHSSVGEADDYSSLLPPQPATTSASAAMKVTMIVFVLPRRYREQAAATATTGTSAQPASSRMRAACVAGSLVVASVTLVREPKRAERTRTDARRPCQPEVTRMTSSTPRPRAARATASALPIVERAFRSRMIRRAGEVQARAISSASGWNVFRLAQPEKITESSGRTSFSARARRAAQTGCSALVRRSEYPRTATRRIRLSVSAVCATARKRTAFQRR